MFWLLEPAKPVRVYSQGAYGYMKEVNGSYDIMWSTVTMDNGVLVSIGGGWNLPPSYPNYCATTIEITGTEGSLFLDDTQRSNWLNTMKDGTQYPMSTMPGEWVDHVYAGQMAPETLHFLECVLRDPPPMVSPQSARRVMETYLAADLSAESGEPVQPPAQQPGAVGGAGTVQEIPHAGVAGRDTRPRASRRGLGWQRGELRDERRGIRIVSHDRDFPPFTCPHPRLGQRDQRTRSLHSYSFSFFFRDNFE